jgi:hypothetical protein
VAAGVGVTALVGYAIKLWLKALMSLLGARHSSGCIFVSQS